MPSIQNRLPLAAVLAGVALLAACQDQPLAPPVSAPAGSVTPPANAIAALACRADVRAGSLSCADARSGVRGDLLTFGGQNHYVRLASTALAFNGATGELSAKVSVQNLLTVPLATADGTTADAAGLQVFFSAPPSNGVAVVNPTGYGAFTAANQAFYQYDDDGADEVPAPELGGNGILSPGETTADKLWRFQTNGASVFTFTVYLQTQVPNATAAFLHLATLSEGEMHGCGLSAAGRAYCWGHGQYGEVGDGATTTRLVPTPVGTAAVSAWGSIAVGNGHTCALTPAGTAYCWGLNLFGGVGDGSTSNRGVPTPVTGAPPLASVAGGNYSTCGLTAAGQAYCWGWNAFGQLGDGTLTQRTTAVAAIMPPGVAFASIEMGGQHACALTAGGQAYCWGDNSYGQVGDGTRLQRTVPTPAYQPGGRVYTALSVGTYRTCGLTPAGKVFCWGNPNDGHFATDTAVAAPQPAGLAFTRVEVGHSEACGLTAAGAVLCWGANGYGSLGNGGSGNSAAPTPVVTPVGVTFTTFSVATYSGCALTASSGAYCWGANGSGGLGDGTSVNRLLPVPMAGTY